MEVFHCELSVMNFQKYTLNQTITRYFFLNVNDDKELP